MNGPEFWISETNTVSKIFWGDKSEIFTNDLCALAPIISQPPWTKVAQLTISGHSSVNGSDMGHFQVKTFKGQCMNLQLCLTSGGYQGHHILRCQRVRQRLVSDYLECWTCKVSRDSKQIMNFFCFIFEVWGSVLLKYKPYPEQLRTLTWRRLLSITPYKEIFEI